MGGLKFEILILDQKTVTLSGNNDVNSESLNLPDLKQPGEHMESKHGAGPIGVRQHLVDVAAPGFLLVLAGHRLEGGDYGGKEWRRQRRCLHFWKTIWLFLILTINTDHRNHNAAILEEQTVT